MSRPINLLSHRKVEALKEPGRYSDGGGLYLHVDQGGAKRWVFIYQRDKRRREMGLGSADPKIGASLAEARDARDAAHRLLREGKDPIQDRKQQKRVVPKFGDYARLVVAGLPLTSDKYRKQWERTLTDLAPQLQDKPVDAIATEDVLAVLRPHWTRIPETAERLRGRIERVLDSARAQGLIDGAWANPARWKGHIQILLPTAPRDVKHHTALAYEEIGGFMADLRQRSGSAPRALEFTILTAARTSETIGATWGEIDLDEKLWVIPKGRMKMKREHRVPLSDAALAVLEQAKLPVADPSAYVFPGGDMRSPLSTGGMERVLDRMKVAVTVHGFRSTFRDWAGDCTGFPSNVIEAALAHQVGDATERAYRRSDALEKRRKLMEAWAAFCGRKAGENVKPMKKAAG